jgi:hypothetical protein
MLGIITCVLEENSGVGGVSVLEPYLSILSDSQRDCLVTALRDWNTNSRHCYASQAVLACLLSILSTDRLLESRALVESLAGLQAYSERHFQRIDRLFQSAYVLEFMSGQMSLMPTEQARQVGDKLTGGNMPTAGQDEEDEYDLALRIFGQSPSRKRPKSGDRSSTVKVAKNSSKKKAPVSSR